MIITISNANADEWINISTFNTNSNTVLSVGQTFTTPNTNRPIVLNISVNSVLTTANTNACIYTSSAATTLIGCSDTKTINSGWEIFNFSQNNYYAANTQYYLEIDSTTDSLGLTYNTADVYSGGHLFIARSQVTGLDLSFRINGINGTSVGNWTLNQGTGIYANDSSGFNNNGTVSGATWYSDSVNSYALHFNAGADKVTIPQNNSLNLSSGVTISGWYKQTSNPGTFPILFGRTESYFMAVHSTGRIYGAIDNAAGQQAAYSTSIPIIPNNQWHFVMMTYDNSTVTTYYDNVAYSTLSATGNMDASAANVYLGSDGTNSINGLLDEIKLYNYALNSSERTAIYQQFQPVPAYPTGALTIAATYPPQTTSVNFSWHDTEYSADELIVALDSNFNLIVLDEFTSNDYKLATLNSGRTYYWKVRQYNPTTGTYGATSQTVNFSISSASSSTGQGVQGVVYELIEGQSVPVDQAQVYIYNSSYSDFMTTGSNGYYLFDGLANGTYSVYAVKQDYDTTAALPVNVNGSLATQDILMKKYISPYVPNFVYEKFIVRGLFDNSYPDVTVNVYTGDSQAISFTGTTDSMGQAVFRLVKDQKYRVTFSGGGIGSDITVHIYAKEESYYVRVMSGFPTGGDRNSDITSNLTTSAINATWSNLSLIYNDTTGTTTQIWFYARNLTTNQTVCYQSSTAQTAYLNCSVYASGSYVFGFNSTNTKYGFFKRDSVINFNVGKPATPAINTNIDQTLLQWASIILIIIVSALFSAKSVRYGAVVVPVFALVLWAMGWFQPMPGNTAGSILVLSCAVALGIMIYLRSGEAKTIT